jgi:hypothetical protein
MESVILEVIIGCNFYYLCLLLADVRFCFAMGEIPLLSAFVFHSVALDASLFS